MPAEIEIKACGGRFTLAMPIGFIDDVARHEPELQQIIVRLSTGHWTPRDLRVVIDTAAKWGKAKITADEIMVTEGITRAIEIALDVMLRTFQHPDDAEVPEGEATATPAADGA